MFSPESEDSSTEQQPWQIVKWHQKLPCEKQGTRASRKLSSDANFDFTWHDCLAVDTFIRLAQTVCGSREIICLTDAGGSCSLER